MICRTLTGSPLAGQSRDDEHSTSSVRKLIVHSNQDVQDVRQYLVAGNKPGAEGTD